MRDLTDWYETFFATYNSADPGSSGFETTDAELTFNDRGQELARRLREELDDSWEVFFFDLVKGAETEVIST